MYGTPSDFWGKLTYEANAERPAVAPGAGRVISAWHPLLDHCLDVAACCEHLLSHTLLAGRLARIAGLEELSPGQVSRLCVLAGLHDLGKYNLGFQNKRLDQPPFTAGHVREAMALFGSGSEESARLAEALEIDRLASWAESTDTVLRLLMAAICHHGRPQSMVGDHRPLVWADSVSLRPFGGIRELATTLYKAYPAAWSGDGVLPASTRFQHAFAGVVTLSDWLGSDASAFPYSLPDDPPRLDRARQLAARLMRDSWIDPTAPRSSLGPERPDFSRVSEFRPRPPQTAIEALPIAAQAQVVVLEAETGAGKTEAALLHFARLFQAGVVDGLYFALPTRTAAYQIHDRICQMVARLFEQPDERPPVVLAVPGYLQVDEARGKRLAPFHVLWPDRDSDRWRYRGWAAEHPKRYLAGTIVVGTIDQALLSAVAVPHAHMRAAALLRHLLVVDEVHASDAYMNELLIEVLRRHAEAGGQALLMSATLGAPVRDRLVGSSSPKRAPSLESSLAVPYPCLTRSATPVAEIRPMQGSGRSKDVAVSLVPDMASPEAVAGRAIRLCRLGGRVLVLRNTVAACMATQRALEAVASGAPTTLFGCGGVPAPHHSRYARADRVLLDTAIEAAFGRRRTGPAVVAVATQTVQQSLDLDADVMITDLCPMDVLLERVGRLHRHEVADRPECCRETHLVVLVPADRDLSRQIARDGSGRNLHGLGSVYPDLRGIEATWSLLETHPVLHIPADNRLLVESATHPEALAAIARRLGDPWAAHGNYIEGKRLCFQQQARWDLTAWSAQFGDDECLFPTGDLARSIGTRLGEDDRWVSFEDHPLSPFGAPIEGLTIPAHLARGIERDDPGAGPTELASLESGFRFRMGSRSYIYDRLGLRPDDTRAENEDADA